MTTDPEEYEAGSKIAIERHRRALSDVVAKLCSLHAEHEAKAVDDAIGSLRDFAEIMFGTITAQDLALAALMHEVIADRRVAVLMMGALLRQTDVDRDQLHADFLYLAKGMFKCGPESFPDQARDAAIMLSGKLPT